MRKIKISAIIVMSLLVISIIAIQRGAPHRSNSERYFLVEKFTRGNNGFTLSAAPVHTYGNTTYISNISLMTGLIAERDSSVFGENIELFTFSPDGEWYFVARDDSRVILTNVTISNTGSLSIYTSDSAEIIIRDSVLPSLAISAQGSSRVKIFNSIIRGDLRVDAYDSSEVFISDGVFHTNYTAYPWVGINAHDSSSVYFSRVAFLRGTSLQFSIFSYDSSYAVFTDSFVNSTAFGVYGYDNSSVSFMNISTVNPIDNIMFQDSAHFTIESSNLELLYLIISYMSTLGISSSTLNVSQIYLSTIGSVLIESSTIRNFNLGQTSLFVEFPVAAYGNGLRTGTSPTIAITNSTIDKAEFLGAQRISLTNSNIGNLLTTLWFYGDVDLIDGVFYPSPSTIGPYPFINSGSTITTLNNDTSFVVLSGNGFIDNSTLSTAYFVDSNYDVNGSDIGNLFWFNSNLTIENLITTWFWYEGYGGRLSINNSSNLTGGIEVYNDDTAIKVTNSSLTNLDVSGNMVNYTALFDGVVLLDGSYFSLYNDGLNSSITLGNIVPENNSASTSGFFDLLGGSLIVENSNLTGIDMTIENVMGTFVNTIINGYLDVRSGSTLYFYNTTVDSSYVTIDQGEMVYFYNNSWIWGIQYIVWVNGSLYMDNGYIVGGSSYSTNAYFDSTSTHSNAIVTIYANSYVEVNNTVLYAFYYGSGTTFRFDNVTLHPSYGSIEPMFDPFTDDPRLFTINGYINNSDLSTGSLFFLGYGNVTIENSNIGQLTSILTNVTVTGSSVISVLIDVYYANSGSASIINDSPSGFSGSYIDYGLTPVITHYYGVAAFSNSVVYAENSSLYIIVGFGSSKITVKNITGGLTPLIFLMDSANVTLLDVNAVTSMSGMESIILRDSSYLNATNTVYNQILLALDNSNLFTKNASFSFINAYDSSHLDLTNTTILSTMNVISDGNILIQGNQVEVPYLYLSTESIGSTIDVIFSNSSISTFLQASAMSAYDIVLTLVNPTVNQINLVNSRLNLLSELNLPQIPMIYTIFSSVSLTKVNVSSINAISSDVSVNNSMIQDILFGYYSTIDIDNSTIGSIVLSGSSNLTLSNSNVTQALFPYEIAGFFEYPSVFHPDITLTIANSTVNVMADEVDVSGTGYFDFNSGTTTTYLSTTAYNMTTSFTGLTMSTKPTTWFVSLHIEGTTFAKVSNFQSGNGEIIIVIKVSQVTPLQAPLVSVRIDTNVYDYPPGPPSPPVIDLELGAPVNPIIFNVTHSYILDSYEIDINGSIVDSGDIYDLSLDKSFDPSTHITGEGTYIIVFRVTDVYGSTTTATIHIVVHSSEPPTITRTPNGTIEFEIGMNPPNITWTISDLSPDHYEVLVNDTKLFNGTYTDGETVTLNVKGNFTSAGTYNVTLVAYDKANNKASDTVIITVYPSQKPQITSTPNNATINVNQSITLNWTATDRYPATYDIYVNGTKEASDKTWTSGTPIHYTFTPTTKGIYNITIVFKDKAGNTAKSTVWITAIPPTAGGGTGGGTGGGGLGIPPLLIASAAIVIIAIIVIVTVIRRRR